MHVLHAISRMKSTELLDPEATGKVETLRWRDGALEMIDQRVLPMRVEYRRYDSRRGRGRRHPQHGGARGAGNRLRRRLWRRAGSAAPGSAAAAAAFCAGLEARSSFSARSRPTAVNLSWALASPASPLSLALGAAGAARNRERAAGRSARDSRRGHRDQPRHGQPRRRAGSGRRARADPLQRRRAGHRRPRHGARA